MHTMRTNSLSSPYFILFSSYSNNTQHIIMPCVLYIVDRREHIVILCSKQKKVVQHSRIYTYVVGWGKNIYLILWCTQQPRLAGSFIGLCMCEIYGSIHLIEFILYKSIFSFAWISATNIHTNKAMCTATNITLLVSIHRKERKLRNKNENQTR